MNEHPNEFGFGKHNDDKKKHNTDSGAVATGFSLTSRFLSESLQSHCKSWEWEFLMGLLIMFYIIQYIMKIPWKSIWVPRWQEDITGNGEGKEHME